MADRTYPGKTPGSIRGEPSRWQTQSPKGVMMSDEAFGALESFPEARRFRCRVCGTRQFVLGDARISDGVKEHWQCDCTRTHPGGR